MKFRIKTKILAVLLIISLIIIALLSSMHYFMEKKLADNYTKYSISSLQHIAHINNEISNQYLTPFTERYLQLAVDDISDEIRHLKHANNKIDNKMIQKDDELNEIIKKYSWVGVIEFIKIVVIDDTHIILSANQTDQNTTYQHWIDLCPEMEQYIQTNKNFSGYYNFEVEGIKTPVYINVLHIEETPYDVVAFLNLKKYLAPSNSQKKEQLDSELKKLAISTKEFMHKTIVNIGIVSSIIIFVILIFCIPVSIFFATTVTRPIRMLSDIVKKMGKGNFNIKIKEQGSLEVTELIKSFNYLGEELQEYIKNLEIEIKTRQKVEDDIRVAAGIQLSLLPEVTSKFKSEEFSLSAQLDPAKDVSGDFYDFFYLGEDKIVLVLADVSGKGIPAAFFMALSKTVLRNVCENETDPAVALSKTNNILSTNNTECMFVTIFLVYYDIKTGKADFANAGHHENHSYT